MAVGWRGAGVSDFFYYESKSTNLKYKKKYLGGGGGGGARVGWLVVLGLTAL